jgi:hypothetical protein
MNLKQKKIYFGLTQDIQCRNLVSTVNEPSGFKRGEFLGQPSDCQLLQKDLLPWTLSMSPLGG